MEKMNFIEKFSSGAGYLTSVVGSMLILLITGHILLGVASEYSDAKKVDKRIETPVYDDYPGSRELWSELEIRNRMHFEPYYHWRHDPFQGQYVNVSEEGVRRTLPLVNSRGAEKIFIFGGSTLWGLGTKDEHTIPSFVQSFMGQGYKVTNYGQPGFVATQELNLLLQQLALGNIPDVVIFYDGVNDGYAGVYSPAIPRDVMNLRMNRKKSREEKDSFWLGLFKKSNYSDIRFFKKISNSLTGKVSKDEWGKKIEGDITSNSRSVVGFYEAHIKQVNALAREYGFKVFFLWQPNLLSGTRHMLGYEEAIFDDERPIFVESQRQVYVDAKAAFSGREDENIYFLGDIFNDQKIPVYIDYCHMGPAGNEIIARRMVDIIKEQPSSWLPKPAAVPDSERVTSSSLFQQL